MIKRYYFSKTKHPKIEANISCIGNFDAVHKGHQLLINKTIKIARKKGYKAYAIVFSKDPSLILFNEKPIHSLNDRVKLFEKYGLDGVIIIENNKRFLNTPSETFIKDYLKKMNIKGLVVGRDYTFGKDRVGNVSLLRKSFNNLYVCDYVKYYGAKISTTRIKKELKNRNINKVNKMLGYEYR